MGEFLQVYFFLAGIRRGYRRLIYFLKGNLILNWLVALIFNFSHPLCHRIIGEGIVFLSLLRVQVLNMGLLVLGGMFIIWFRVILWLNLKTQVRKNLSFRTLVLSWSYMLILLIWFNTRIFF